MGVNHRLLSAPMALLAFDIIFVMSSWLVSVNEMIEPRYMKCLVNVTKPVHIGNGVVSGVKAYRKFSYLMLFIDFLCGMSELVFKM